MGFVYEEISEQKGQELYDKYHFTQTAGVPVIPRQWLADEKRDAYLIPVRPFPGAIRHDLVDMPGVFNLILNDEPIKIEGYHLGNETERTIKIYIKGVGIPQSLAGKESEIIELAKEAVMAYYTRLQDSPNSAAKDIKYTIEEAPNTCYIWDGPFDKEQQ